MSGVCAVVAGGLLLLAPAERFQLAWTHSVEKVEWREEWRVEAGRLVLERASVQGSGAGMEPPPEARRQDGRWVWEPNIHTESVTLALSGYTTDWSLCNGGGCRVLKELSPGEATVTLAPCR